MFMNGFSVLRSCPRRVNSSSPSTTRAREYFPNQMWSSLFVVASVVLGQIHHGDTGSFLLSAEMKCVEASVISRLLRS